MKPSLVARTNSSAFKRGLDHLDAFRAATGHARVPRQFVSDDGYPLGRWVRNLRAAYRSGKLEPERVAALDERGMVWDPFDTAFQAGLDHLDAFRAATGHARVPTQFLSDDGYPLGKWVSNIRAAYRSGKLEPERVATLDERGMVWNARTSTPSEAGLDDSARPV